MSSYNQNSGYGAGIIGLVSSIVPAFGRIFVVFNSSDTKESYDRMRDIMRADTDGKVRFFTSISDAYTATTSNNNDVILLDSHTSHKVSSMLTISKNRIHFIGMDAGGRLNNARTLISNTGAGAATDTSMIKITGTGITFRNISFKNNWTAAENLYGVSLEAASYVYFENCTFNNLGSAHLTNANCAPLGIVAGGDHEFKNCTFGSNTLKMTASGGQVVLLSGAVTRTIWTNCLWMVLTSQTNYTMVNISGDGSNDMQLFRGCAFLNRVNGGATAAVAVKSGATTAGLVVFDTGTFCAGCTDFATAAVGNTGMYIASPVPTAGTSGIAVQPTA